MDMSVVTYLCISHFKANNHKKIHQKKTAYCCCCCLLASVFKTIDLKMFSKLLHLKLLFCSCFAVGTRQKIIIQFWTWLQACVVVGCCWLRGDIALKLDIYANFNLFKCHQTKPFAKSLSLTYSLSLTPCVIVFIFFGLEEDGRNVILSFFFGLARGSLYIILFNNMINEISKNIQERKTVPEGSRREEQSQIFGRKIFTKNHKNKFLLRI